MQQTIESPAKQMILQLPAPPPTGSLGIRGELRLVTQLIVWMTAEGLAKYAESLAAFCFLGGGKRQADGFIISAATWEMVAPSQPDDGCPSILPTVAFELLSPAM